MKLSTTSISTQFMCCCIVLYIWFPHFCQQCSDWKGRKIYVCARETQTDRQADFITPPPPVQCRLGWIRDILLSFIPHLLICSGVCDDVVGTTNRGHVNSSARMWGSRPKEVREWKWFFTNGLIDFPSEGLSEFLDDKSKDKRDGGR